MIWNHQITILNPILHPEIHKWTQSLKKKRTDLAHDRFHMKSLQDFEDEVFQEVKNLVTLVAPLRFISPNELNAELDKIKIHLHKVINDVQTSEDNIQTMKVELNENYKEEVKLKFYGVYNPENVRSGSLKNYVEPLFLKEDQEISYGDIHTELQSRRKALLITAEAGMGKTSLSW